MNNTVLKAAQLVCAILLIVSIFPMVNHGIGFADYTYSNAESSIRTFIMAGDDLYDLIINDDRSLIALTVTNASISRHPPTGSQPKC